MKRPRAAALTLVIVVVVVAALAAGPAGASTWSEPRPLFGDGEIYALTATLASGSIMAVAKVDGGLNGTIRPPGGAFGEPFAVVPTTAHPFGLIPGPSGDVAVVYYTGHPSGTTQDAIALRAPDGQIHYASFPNPTGHPWGAYDSAGNLTVTAPAPGGGIAAYTYARDGTMVAARKVSDAQPSGEAVSVTPSDDVMVAFRDGTKGERVLVATAHPGGEFGPPETVARGSYGMNQIKMGVDERGTALVVWSGGPKVPPNQELTYAGPLHYSVRPAGGEWSPPRSIPGDPTLDAGWHWTFAMNRAGEAVLGWSGSTAVSARTLMSYRPAGGSFGPAVASDVLGESEPVVAIGPRGDAVAATIGQLYHPMPGENPYHPRYDEWLDAFDRPRGGAFGPPQRVVDERAQEPAVAVDGVGDAVAIWVSGPGDGKAALMASHRVGAVDPTAPGVPEVSGFSVSDGGTASVRRAAASRKPVGFSYRVSRAARVRIRVARLGAHGRAKLIGTTYSAVRKGDRVDALSRDVLRKVRRGGRFRARIVAVDRAGRRSKARVLTFRAPA